MSWSEFLQRLNPDGNEQLTAQCRLSDGSSLRWRVPPADQIHEDRLIGAAAASFKYQLYEIVELEFEPSAPADALQEQLEEIEQAARVSGLIYRRKPERIIVRSPYTC